MSGPAPQAPVGTKNAGIAAFLNLFWGIGYLYLGYKKVLGLPAIGFVVAMLIVSFVVGIFTVGILSFIIAVVLAIDGYGKAKGRPGFISAQK